MTTTFATAHDRPPTAGAAAARPPWLRWAGWTLAGLGACLAWTGGPVGVLGAAGAVLAGVGAARSGHGESLGKAASGAVGGRHGAEVMVEQVVPVWSRQMDMTRDVATEGLAHLLENFAAMSDALQTLATGLGNQNFQAAPGAVGVAVERESAALQKLLSPSERAFAQRDAVVAELEHCADALLELQHVSKQSREIARHLRLVAFNASIEANRGQQQHDGGSQAVATEVRALATRMASTAEQLDGTVRTLGAALQKARRDSAVDDSNSEELRLEIDLRAREALNALLGGLGAALQGSAEVQQASATLRDQLDQAFVHFQFGDRLSQMLSIVGNDMANFARWVAVNPRATQSDAAEWLEALEGSYTMEEQRSQHHGNAHVDRSSGVEFF
jgi:methyl-accepting chemotaxis protein